MRCKKNKIIFDFAENIIYSESKIINHSMPVRQYKKMFKISLQAIEILIQIVGSNSGFIGLDSI